jgi:hypothetical protein
VITTPTPWLRWVARLLAVLLTGCVTALLGSPLAGATGWSAQPAGSAVEGASAYGYDASSGFAVAATTPVPNVAAETADGFDSQPSWLLGAALGSARFLLAAEGGGGILTNQAAGNAARDAIAAANPDSTIEQTFQTTLGARRIDVLTHEGIGIESKVGYTSLTRSIQSQIAKDQLLMDNGDLSGVQWIFGRSGVTGQVGPSGPLGAALDKAGIPWWSEP